MLNFGSVTLLVVAVLKLFGSITESLVMPGYANELGEAFRALIPTKAVWFTYGLACAYVGCDAADKANSAVENGESARFATLTGCDALVWQGLASVVVPGITINRLCWIVKKACSSPGVSKRIVRIAPVAAGLAAIPFIVHPIDQAVDYAMDLTLRPWIFQEMEKEKGK